MTPKDKITNVQAEIIVFDYMNVATYLINVSFISKYAINKN